jgi:UDP-glucose 4-epimerase
MNTIVTGGAGFIGSHLVEHLISLGHKVTVLDNFSTGRSQNLDHLIKKIKLIECDLNNEDKLNKMLENVDWVFHLAALADIVPSIQDPQKYFNANVSGTINLLKACSANNVSKLIYSASSSCYGIPSVYPTPEEATINPQYPYALTKRMGEELVMHWSHVYNIPAISLRFFNVYGPRSRTSGTYGAVFGVFLAQKLADQPLTVVGDGTQTRDFTFVSDVVDAIYVSAKSNIKNKIFNVGSGKSISINYITKLLNAKTVNIPKRPAEPDVTFADISKIKSELNWQPKVSIEEGIKVLLDNIEYWGNAPIWTPETISQATKDWFHYLSEK